MAPMTEGAESATSLQHLSEEVPKMRARKLTMAWYNDG